jgi:hypothetical protein
VFLRFLEDQLLFFRQAAADLVEAGNHTQLQELRGRILTMREMQGLTLAQLRQFYLPDEDTETEEDNDDRTDPHQRGPS